MKWTHSFGLPMIMWGVLYKGTICSTPLSLFTGLSGVYVCVSIIREFAPLVHTGKTADGTSHRNEFRRGHSGGSGGGFFIWRRHHYCPFQSVKCDEFLIRQKNAA